MVLVVVVVFVYIYRCGLYFMVCVLFLVELRGVYIGFNKF